MPNTDSEVEYLENTVHYQDPDRERGGGKHGGTRTRKAEAEENFDDEPDETISERLWGLAEMFPEPLREFTCALVCLTTRGVRSIYRFSCSASWIFFTTSIILFAPVIFETERAQMEEIQKQEQKQVLLGPGSAMTEANVEIKSRTNPNQRIGVSKLGLAPPKLDSLRYLRYIKHPQLLVHDMIVAQKGSIGEKYDFTLLLLLFCHVLWDIIKRKTSDPE
uniref:Mitochondrial import receptor subunit TOM22 homolog n=1 Tax=Glossina palpalis gambiensis TaxID=67801 RepID=A0A1B0BNG9_9MUSC